MNLISFLAVNTVERRRRDKINNWIVQLSKLIPDCAGDHTKQGQVGSRCKMIEMRKSCLVEGNATPQIFAVVVVSETFALFRDENVFLVIVGICPLFIIADRNLDTEMFAGWCCTALSCYRFFLFWFGSFVAV